MKCEDEIEEYEGYISVRKLCKGVGHRLGQATPENFNRGRNTGRLKSDKKHLYTHNKITRMTHQILGCNTNFTSFLTVRFSWEMNGMKLKNALKQLKRKLSSFLKKYGGKALFGALEGWMFSTNGNKVVPPHYHILLDVQLSHEDELNLKRLLVKWGFASFDYQLIEGSDLRLRKYLFKKYKEDKDTGKRQNVKPTMMPDHWADYNIPCTFKSKNFMDCQSDDIFYVSVKELSKISSSQVYYVLQYLDESLFLREKDINSSEECHNLNDLILGCFFSLLFILALFPNRFLDLGKSMNPLPFQPNIEKYHPPAIRHFDLIPDYHRKLPP